MGIRGNMNGGGKEEVGAEAEASLTGVGRLQIGRRSAS